MYFVNLCLYFVLRLYIIPWSIGWRTLVVLGGKKCSVVDWRFLSWGFAEQLSTNIRILRFWARNFLSRPLIHLINKALVIHDFFVSPICGWKWMYVLKTSGEGGGSKFPIPKILSFLTHPYLRQLIELTCPSTFYQLNIFHP